MASLTTSLNTDFTPAAGDFNVQVTGGRAGLVRKNNSGATYALVGYLNSGDAVIVSNPIAGAVYQVQGAGVTIAVDQ